MDGREHKLFIWVSAVAPFVAFLTALVLLWNRDVGLPDLVTFLVMYVVAALGVSTGYHRLLAHRAFKTSRPLRIFFTAAGAVAGQGPPLIWTAHHRRHHRLADKPGDPHSPYVSPDPDGGDFRIWTGLWHAHMGWLFDTSLTSDPIRYCPDLARDKDVRFLSRHFVACVIGGIVFPGFLDYALTGTPAGFLKGMLWGGLVRFMVGNHVTYAVNSVGHYFGYRNYATPDESRNVAWLSIPSFGESWHNNHHAFPRSYRHGMKWYEIDLSAATIMMLEKLGLVWDVVRLDPAAVAKKADAMRLSGGGRKVSFRPDIPLAEKARVPASVTATDVE